MSINFDRALGLHPQALQLTARRAELLASNIANSDTPGYKARDIDFNSLLAQQGGATALESDLLRTHANHLAVGGTAAPDQETSYRQSLQPSIDGNSVDLQVEQAEFAQNVLHYQTSLALLRGRFDGLSRAIRGE